MPMEGALVFDLRSEASAEFNDGSFQINIPYNSQDWASAEIAPNADGTWRYSLTNGTAEIATGSAPSSGAAADACRRLLGR